MPRCFCHWPCFCGFASLRRRIALAFGNHLRHGLEPEILYLQRLMVAELLPHATAGRRRGSLPWTVQASATSARRSSTSPRLLLT